MSNYLDPEAGRHLRAIILESQDNRESEAIVESIGLDVITVRLKGTGARVRGVRVIGGTDNILAGDRVYLQRQGDVTLATNPRGLQGGTTLVQSAPHTHADLYFSQAEVQSLLDGKADAGHTHAPSYISAIGGTIAAFVIEEDYLRDKLDTFGLNAGVSEADDVRFWAGASYLNRATAPFRVTESGVVISSAGIIGGWHITPTALVSPTGQLILDSTGNLRGNFSQGYSGWRMTEQGNLEANNIDVRGQFRASVFVMDEAHAVGGRVIVRPAGTIHETVTTI